MLMLDDGEASIFRYQFTPALSLSVDLLSAFFFLVVSVVSFSVGVFSPGRKRLENGSFSTPIHAKGARIPSKTVKASLVPLV